MATMKERARRLDTEMFISYINKQIIQVRNNTRVTLENQLHGIRTRLEANVAGNLRPVIQFLTHEQRDELDLTAFDGMKHHFSLLGDIVHGVQTIKAQEQQDGKEGKEDSWRVTAHAKFVYPDGYDAGPIRPTYLQFLLAANGPFAAEQRQMHNNKEFKSPDSPLKMTRTVSRNLARRRAKVLRDLTTNSSRPIQTLARLIADHRENTTLSPACMELISSGVRLGLEEAVPGAPDTEWSVILQYYSNVRQEAANIFSQIDEVVASDISDDSEMVSRCSYAVNLYA